MTTKAQHERLKSEQGWTLAVSTDRHPQTEWSEMKAQQLAAQAISQLPEVHW